MDKHFRRAALFSVALVVLLLAGGQVFPSFLTQVTAAPAQPPAGQDPEAKQPTPEQVAFFKNKIQPIFVNHCYDCHSAATRSAGGLRLDGRYTILAGGKSGAAINLEKPEESLLLARVLSADPKRRMPKGEDDPLPAEDIANLKAWIAQGAFWPVVPGAEAGRAPTGATAEDGGKKTAGKLVKVAYPRPATPDQLAYFEKNVRPILVNDCYNCH